MTVEAHFGRPVTIGGSGNRLNHLIVAAPDMAFPRINSIKF